MVLHRLIFITLTMTALGLVALVIWEGVFPDRRDARILGSLPLRSRTLIAARLGALGALAGIFIVGDERGADAGLRPRPLGFWRRAHADSRHGGALAHHDGGGRVRLLRTDRAAGSRC